jgi:hypothetical protein
MQIARQHASIDGGTAAGIINKMDVVLSETKDALVDDFRHGMMGSQRLKKDPVVSIVGNQNNSPGAVQQIGVGNFSQSAFVQNHKPLVEAIDAALSSAEFKALPEPDQQGFRDVAEVVKEEAYKDTPDSGKLKRWGERLVEFGDRPRTEGRDRNDCDVIGKNVYRCLMGLSMVLTTVSQFSITSRISGRYV